MRTNRFSKLLAGLAVLAGTALSLAPAAGAASCARLQIPAAGINRCVVTGGQRAIDAGQVVRYSALSGGGRDWIAAHRTSHGGSFRSLTRLRVGDAVVWKGRSYKVTQHTVVNRRRPGRVLGWGPLVLQTSKSGGDVYVWRLSRV